LNANHWFLPYLVCSPTPHGPDIAVVNIEQRDTAAAWHIFTNGKLVIASCRVNAHCAYGPYEDTLMKSLVVKRSIVIAGHKTSVSLEDAFWRGLKEIANDKHLTVSDMVGEIDTGRRQGNLSSAIRLFVLDKVRSQISEFTPLHDGIGVVAHSGGQNRS
jgi:predicted DNA-binding ribbon-helix-helix protein